MHGKVIGCSWGSRLTRFPRGSNSAEAASQRPFAGNVPCAGLELAHRHGQCILQDRTQPGGELGLGLAPKLSQFFMRFQKRLLDDIGGI
jgi:hypothetical protein